MATSDDGQRWQPPVQVASVRAEAFVPGIAVTRDGSRLAIVFHAQSAEGVDVWLIESRDGGATWRRPQLLSAEPMPLDWMPSTDIGRMLADYISVSYVAGRPVPVFALASEPTGDALRQAIFAATVPTR
jgi:photosystem II stability/assembly factor-like uncharacterized protein